MNTVHIDEKWFYVMKLHGRIFAALGEMLKMTSAKSERFLTKVMFLAAVAHPRQDKHRKSISTVRLDPGRLLSCKQLIEALKIGQK